jgi:hypothetical protein
MNEGSKKQIVVSFTDHNNKKSAKTLNADAVIGDLVTNGYTAYLNGELITDPATQLRDGDKVVAQSPSGKAGDDQPEAQAEAAPAEEENSADTTEDSSDNNSDTEDNGNDGAEEVPAEATS